MRSSVIAITGTPGTGKTQVSRVLAKRLHYRHLELNRAIVKCKLYSGYDRKRKSYIADMRKVTAYVKETIKENPNIIVDSHLAHELPRVLIGKVVILRCRPDELKRRLKAKGWNKAKVEENVEAEMIGVIAYEARKRHRNAIEVDATHGPAIRIAVRVEKALKGKPKTKPIDWLR
jgi:adenylate kinase